MPYLGSMNLTSLTESDLSEKTVVIPFAALEPVGETLPLSVLQDITEAVAGAIAKRDNAIVVPAVTAFATPVQGFRGVISLRRKVFMNQLADIVLNALSWGVRRVLFLDGTCYSKQSVDMAMKRFKRKLPEDFTYGVISWQADPALNRAVSQSSGDLVQRWRNEAAAVILHSELTGSAPVDAVPVNKNISQAQFEKWRKSGRDPEKLVKYFPNAHLSSWSSLSLEEPLMPILLESIFETMDKGYIYHGV